MILFKDVAGLYVYDAGYMLLDECTKWYNSKVTENFKPASLVTRFITCPSTAIGAFFHPLFRRYGGKTWQSTDCYFLRTSIFAGILPQQFCCYDFSRAFFGSLVTQGYDAGFVYNDRSVAEVISNGLKCCAGGDAGNCDKFYGLYPRTRQVPSLFPFGKYTSPWIFLF